MSLIVHCAACGSELDCPGALIIGIPDEYGNTKKWHICRPCWQANRSVQIKF